MTAYTLTSFDAPHSPATLAGNAPPAELLRRVSEDVALWPQPWRWWQDTGLGFGAFGRGASGTTNDRKGGRNLPLFWSEIDLRGFRVLSDFLRQTNPFAIGFAGRLVDYHVRKGFGWQACLKGRKKTAYPTVDAEPDPAVEKGQRILDSWRDQNLWPLKSRESFDRWITTGDLFGRLGKGAWGELPWFRFIDPSQVGSPSGSTDGPDSFGIETPEGDQQGPPVRYHVWDMDSGMSEGAWIDADRIIHAKRNVTSDIKRGLPDFFPLHEWLDGSRKLLWNMIDTAGKQAKIAWREKFPTATAEQVRTLIPQVATSPGNTTAQSAYGLFGHPYYDERGYGAPVGINRFDPSEVIRVEGNREFESGPTFAGSASYIEVEQAALRGCGARWGMPEYFSGDASNNNFASSLVSGSPFAVAVEGGQLAFGECWEKPIAMKVLELAYLSGLLTRDEWQRLDVEITPPAVVTPKPLEDTQQRQILNQNKILSPQTWQLLEQLDPQHEAANWQAFTTQGGADLDGPMDPLADMGMQPDDGAAISFESMLFSEAAYRILTEDQRVGLVKKQITNRAGHHQTVYVRPDDPADSGQNSSNVQPKGAAGRALSRIKHLGSAALNTRVGRFLQAVEHKLMIVAHKTRDIAIAAAKGKKPPLTPEQSARLHRVLFIADFLGGYVTGAAGGAIGGVVGAKIGMLLPSASALYLAYATVRDPAGVWAAARQVVKATITGAAHEGKIPGLAEMLADLLSSEDGEWKEAVFLAALAEGATPERALEAAANAGAMPAELPEPTAEDFGETVSESRILEGPPGPPPREGLVWKDSTSRWVSPETGDEHGDDGEPVAHEGDRVSGAVGKVFNKLGAAIASVKSKGDAVRMVKDAEKQAVSVARDALTASVADALPEATEGLPKRAAKHVQSAMREAIRDYVEQARFNVTGTTEDVVDQLKKGGGRADVLAAIDDAVGEIGRHHAGDLDFAFGERAERDLADSLRTDSELASDKDAAQAAAKKAFAVVRAKIGASQN